VSRKEEEMRGWMDLGTLSRPRSGAAADRGGATADRGGAVTGRMRGETGRRGAGEGRSRGNGVRRRRQGGEGGEEGQMGSGAGGRLWRTAGVALGRTVAAACVRGSTVRARNVSLGKKDRRAGDGAEGQKWEGENDGPWEGAGADARTTGEPHTSFFS
jgi:hypothetical protein